MVTLSILSITMLNTESTLSLCAPCPLDQNAEVRGRQGKERERERESSLAEEAARELPTPPGSKDTSPRDVEKLGTSKKHRLVFPKDRSYSLGRWEGGWGVKEKGCDMKQLISDFRSGVTPGKARITILVYEYFIQLHYYSTVSIGGPL